jgi:hypothetical protein
MDDSLSEWLELREAADWAARSADLVEQVTATLAPRGALEVLDLCTGTGSNIRYLMDRLPPRQRWLAVDRDPALLAEVHERLSSWASAHHCPVRRGPRGSELRGERLECDVATEELNLDDLDPRIFAGRHLVTASALLDLVSVQWLRTLASRCRAVGAAAIFTITYDGRSTCAPAEPEDELVRALFNDHQRGDKGLGGPAAGPDACEAAQRAFGEAGYRVEIARSDWTVGPREQMFQRRLIEGWASAATEVAPDRAILIADWLRRRLEHVDAGRSAIVVGHQDMAAWLTGRW